MTSRLRRKHQITQPNTPLLKPARLIPAAALVLLLIDVHWSSADEQPSLRVIPDEVQSIDESRLDVSPLKSLKRRSSKRRWELTSQELKTLVTEGKREEGKRKSVASETVKDELDVFAEPQEPPGLPSTSDDTGSEERKTIPIGFSKPSNSVQNDRLYEDDPGLPRNSVRNPSQLKKITEILPFSDYTSDGEAPSGHPCEYLCPRPDGAPCKDFSEGKNPPECPEEITLGDIPYEGRSIPDSLYWWEASNLYHNPLYFQDVSLERYGHTHNEFIQPFVSVGKFGVQLIGLPYQMAIDPIHKRRYTLGWYRPGEYAPKKIYQIPLSIRAGVAEAGVLTGLIFLIP